MKRTLFLGLLVVSCNRTQELASQAQEAPKPALSAPANEPVTVGDPSEPWNPKGIDWKPFDEGLAIAQREKKPVCLVLYTTWCQHCRNYSRVFGDPRLVMRAKDFVMVRVDADANDAISKRYSSDGTYVPRTFFLDGNGNVNPMAKSDHPRYAHFFDEMHADSLLEAMDAARPPPMPH